MTMNLDPMLLARSVAVVGASERRGSVGDQTMRQLISGGFEGPIYPVNPRYEEVHGHLCAPDLESVGETIDLVVLAVANSHLERAMEEAVKIGAGSVAIFASCHGESADDTPLRGRLHDLAAEAGIPICGGNGMGFLNVEARLRVCGFYQPPDLRPGGVTFLSHSGSLFSALLHNRRGIDFNLVVSTGLEINTSMDRYLEWALDRDSTRVVAMFLETIRDPEGFRSALSVADTRDIPVVALKVGASPQGQAAVSTHSEALAGEDAVYEALFEAHGVHRMQTMDEMADTLELFATGRRATAPGVGAVHDSGGERALLIDTAERVGVDLPQLGEEATRRVAAVLDPGLEPSNPIDAWGTGRDAEEVFAESLGALADDPGIGVVVFCVDLTTEEDGDSAYVKAPLDASARSAKPVVVLGNLSTTIDPFQARAIRDGGVPVLEGTETGLRAVGHLLARYRRRSLPDSAPRLTTPGDPAKGSAREAAGLSVLASYGIPVPGFAEVDTVDAALSAGAELGYPVVLKSARAGDHKTERGGVVTGIDCDAGLERAYLEMSGRLGPECLVAQMIGPGIQVGLGMITDPQFGPVLIVSAGGTLIELLDDRVALFPPVDVLRARMVLERLSMKPLFSGTRGQPGVDLGSLSEVIARFSELVVDAAGTLTSIDVNPVIAGAERSVAVDVLMKGM